MIREFSPSDMTYDAFLELLQSRRSIRYFSDKPVDPAAVEKILNAAILAPSVENLQPWHFHIVETPELKAKLMQMSCYGNFVVGAATFMVVSCDRLRSAKATAPIWNPHELEFSCVAAINDAMLAATSLGIGSCWVSLHHGPSHNLLRLKDHHVIVGGLMLGHFKEGEENASGSHQRSPLTDVITRY